MHRLAVIFGLFFPTLAGADEAILPNGSRVAGTFHEEKGSFHFQAKNKTYALDQLHHIRFTDAACPVPKAALTHQIVLPDDQSLTGELLAFDADEVRFRSFTGTILKLPRAKLVGISHPAGWRLLHREALAEQTWAPQVPLPPGRLLFFVEQKDKGPLAIDAVLSIGKNARTVTLAMHADHYAVAGSVTKVPASPGRHQVQIDSHAGTLRICVDDAVLGSETLQDDVALDRLEFRLPKGAWIIDDVMYLVPAAAPKVNQLVAGLDTVCLTNGDELYGKITGADARSVALDAKFGKRSFPWSALQAVYFAAARQTPAVGEVLLWAAPGPGFASDRISGKLLPSGGDNLILRHATLGNLTFERARCRRLAIGPPAKK